LELPGPLFGRAPHGEADAGGVCLLIFIFVSVQNIPLLGEIMLVFLSIHLMVVLV